ncbi:unnamed protein product (macronuclear) [Paramecium tetraurelia]|uniref:EF-hand domain-containing protein n=1 Tax=Paramecium tetraurelia TaxID=5888 RepID=A0CGR2_PARTE|nr:uncharacterized protein GSPATT00007419001 [Paramecium tetraurelia]CAK69979.1 unnamed protein product [Paramecium tetraurelia]|eukprot:XP_001437376.1 hypothetical protein (macronuclear) [Paramecium tetraurelia strain d4-2]
MSSKLSQQQTPQKPIRHPPLQRLKPEQYDEQPQQVNVFDPQKYVKPGLSKEDVIKIKECFDIFDDDKSGAISPNELKNAIVALGMEQSIEDIVNMIQDLDQDGSRQVDFEEFLQIFGFQGSIEDEEVLTDLYKQFDSSKEGKITYEDFKRINELVSERYTDQELREMVQFADLNNDGALNWDEFKIVIQKENSNNKK